MNIIINNSRLNYIMSIILKMFLITIIVDLIIGQCHIVVDSNSRTPRQGFFNISDRFSSLFKREKFIKKPNESI